MGPLNSFANSHTSFAIEWADIECSKVGAYSTNINAFLCPDKLSREGFSFFIVHDDAREIRDSKLKSIKQLPMSIGHYSISGHPDSIHFVTEEIVVDEFNKRFSIFTDITDLVQENHNLKETSERLDLVLRGTNLGMWDWNPQTNEVVFDQRWAEMLGVNLSNLTLTLKDWVDRVHEDDIEECFADINAHVEGKTKNYENTHRMKHADGTWRYILDRGEVVKRDDNGKPIRFTGTHTDVTELKLAEESAKSALAARNQFFARMSHEIRTPLHGILGTVDILTRKNLPKETKHLVNIINESSEILERLLNDLLDVAKIEDGELQLAVREVDILPVIKNVFKLYGQRAKSKGLSYQFRNNTDRNTLLVNTDAARVNQILSNIISNAIKFTNDGHVSLDIYITNNKLIVSVSDTGMGIEDTNTVFEPYVQEGNQYSKVMGTGLGLSIVKNLSERLGIALSLDSKIGKGSTFAFDLGSVLNSTIDENEKRTQCVTEQLSSKFKNALVVDDNEINLFIAKTMLDEFFEQVDFVLSGSEAIKQVQEKQYYDIVFMDLNMPLMDGIETSRRIQCLKLEKMPIIVAQTADATEESRALLEQENVKEVITKPFTKIKFIDLLNKLM